MIRRGLALLKAPQIQRRGHGRRRIQRCQDISKHDQRHGSGQTHLAHRKTKGRQIALPPASLERTTYFRLVIAVRSAENLAMPAAPHQLEPKPPGLIGVKLPSNLAV